LLQELIMKRYAFLLSLLITAYAVAETTITINTDTNQQATLTFKDNINITVNRNESIGITESGDVAYCDNTPLNVVCSAEETFDSIYKDTRRQQYSIPAYQIISIPFTTVSSRTSYGLLEFSSDDSASLENILHTWYSKTPGGPAIQGTNCDRTNQANGNWYWVQDLSLTKQACFLGTQSSLFYFNMETTLDRTFDLAIERIHIE